MILRLTDVRVPRRNVAELRPLCSSQTSVFFFFAAGGPYVGPPVGCEDVMLSAVGDFEQTFCVCACVCERVSVQLQSSVKTSDSGTPVLLKIRATDQRGE